MPASQPPHSAADTGRVLSAGCALAAAGALALGGVADSGAGAGAKACRQRFVVFEVERGEHHFVPGFHPELADRATNPARSDNPDFHFSGGLPRGTRC